MKKIKILYTIPNFDTAGSGKVLYDLAKGLDKDKFEVHIACSHNKGVFFNEVEKLALPIHIIQTTCNPKPYFTLYNRLYTFKNFLKQNHFDIVHSWNWSSDWTEILATRLAGAKYIYTKKAMNWGNIHWKIKSYFANFIITINTEMVSFFPYKKNQKLIPIGVKTDFFNKNLFQKTTNNDTVFKIITVANLVPVKAIEQIIYAINKLKNPTIQFEIIGDKQTDYAKELQELTNRLNLQNQIIFLGKHLDVRPFLSNANLYIISSKSEGMPMALVEAMCMELPVLGSNVKGINFVLNSFPEFLFDSNNSKELPIKIEKMMQKTELERAVIGADLKKFCEENFSMENFIVKHQNLYKKIVL